MKCLSEWAKKTPVSPIKRHLSRERTIPTGELRGHIFICHKIYIGKGTLGSKLHYTLCLIEIRGGVHKIIRILKGI